MCVHLSLCAQLLSKTLDEVMDEEWISALGQEMGLHLNLYGHLPDEKVCCMCVYVRVCVCARARAFMHTCMHLCICVH